MKTTTVTMLTVFLVMALSCIIAQEFAIHLLYDRCQNLSSAYNQLSMSKTQILYLQNMDSGQTTNWAGTTYIFIVPKSDSKTLDGKNENSINIEKVNSKFWNLGIKMESTQNTEKILVQKIIDILKERPESCSASNLCATALNKMLCDSGMSCICQIQIFPSVKCDSPWMI